MTRFNSPPWAVQITPVVASPVVSALSIARMTRFDPSGTDPEMGMANHAHNILLSEAFYPSLHMLEIVVRNRIHEVMTGHAGRPDWFYRIGLIRSDEDQVVDAENKLDSHGKALSPDNIIAALSFGFWCAVLNKRYESPNSLWPRLIPQLIPRAPKPLRSRKEVSGLMEQARKIRNRVFHHEPIAHRTDLKKQYDDLRTLLKMFSPEVGQHMTSICRFDVVRANAPKLTPPDPEPEILTDPNP
jgi:hypothetical protein